MKILPGLFVGSCLLIAAAVHADSSRFPAHYQPAPIDPQLRDTFFDVLLGNKPLDISEDAPDTIDGDARLKEVWLGNKPELEGAIDRVELQFERPGLSEGSPNETFLMSIALHTEIDHDPLIIVKTSKPLASTQQGGLILHLTGNRIRKTLLGGQKMTSVAFALPETTNDGMWGILFCPLDRPSDPSERAKGFRRTGFRPVSARFSVAGSIEGRALSGLLPGTARANIATSPGIPNEKLHFDETYSKDPHIEVSYQGESMTPWTPFSPEGRFLEAMKFELELQTSAGYTRSTVRSETIEISPVEKEFYLPVSAYGIDLRVNSQDCYSLLRTSRTRNHYSKEDLRIPQ